MSRLESLRAARSLLIVLALGAWSAAAPAQFQPFVQQGANQGLGQTPGPLGNLPGAQRQNGAQGGGSQADFESLISLIQSTIAPDSWDEVGGRGSVQPFPSGVYVDAEGVLRKRVRPSTALRSEAQVRLVSASVDRDQSDARKASLLRKISLRRLEQAVARELSAGRAPDEAMLVLAGLEHVQYVLFDSETHDVILAGPAGDWSIDSAGRVIGAGSGLPVVRLDDLVTLLRRYAADAATPLGCSINPRAERLADLQAFLDATSARPLKRGQRDEWLAEMRRRVGRQDVEFFGVDPTSRVAQVLIEADYHMKLVGIGLEPAPATMKSYLAGLEVEPGQAPPPLDVLRWWFTLDDDSLAASPDGQAYELQGDGVQVLSENELLAAQGQRVHTGAAEPLNREFAANFTSRFDELSQMYPIYGDLRNVFQLALTAAIVGTAQRDQRLAWDLGCFGVGGAYVAPRSAVPLTTESVANLRVVRGRQILAIVSGGVRLEPAEAVAAAGQQEIAPPVLVPPADDRWWWD